jgi:hypothetical protein
MDIKRSNSLKKAAKIFCFIFGGLFLAMFVWHYLSSYGFSLDPFVHARRKLWQILGDDIIRAMGGGLAAGAIVYFAGRGESSKAEPSNKQSANS